MKRVVVIGDVHGCLKELGLLLEKLKIRKEEDRVVFVGDLVDRGPDPMGVVRLAREMGAETVMGNHEEKQIRYHKYELRKKENPAAKNPMRSYTDDRLREHFAYTEEDWVYMSKMPATLRLDKKWVVIHGGLDPRKTIAEQDPDYVLRCRYLDANNKMIPLGNDFAAPKGGVFWTERWPGPENVIYGHNVTMDTIREDNRPSGAKILGIDTGCCFGGTLTAVILEPAGPDNLLEWTGTEQVKAERVYHELHYTSVNN
jgi:bis(5'-nucleosyl)-tetraphosphatase (symmetrical)